MFKNVKGVMDAAGTDTSRVLKTTVSPLLLLISFQGFVNAPVQVFLQSMDDFAAFNKLYAEFFAPYKPARSCVEVAKLPLGVRCEMEFIALEK
jgi:enamine deaminase RidA (YjgF/YER057c/UK114 family)